MIRPARPEDEPAIRDCAARAYARYIPVMGRKPAPMLADVAAQIAGGQVHVATGPDGLLGYIVFYRAGDHMLLESVAVLPGAAGRGTGKALIAVCEDAARQLGLRAVQLYTNVRMAENLAIYLHLGYVETARRTEDGFHRVYFEKRLA